MVGVLFDFKVWALLLKNPLHFKHISIQYSCHTKYDKLFPFHYLTAPSLSIVFHLLSSFYFTTHPTISRLHIKISKLFFCIELQVSWISITNKNTTKIKQQKRIKWNKKIHLDVFPALVRSTFVSDILVLFAFIFIYFGCMVQYCIHYVCLHNSVHSLRKFPLYRTQNELQRRRIRRSGNTKKQKKTEFSISSWTIHFKTYMKRNEWKRYKRRTKNYLFSHIKYYISRMVFKNRKVLTKLWPVWIFSEI